MRLRERLIKEEGRGKGIRDPKEIEREIDKGGGER